MKPRVLYVVSRFPKVTETFVVNEWAALRERFEMYLAAMVHTDEPVLHATTRDALRTAWFPSPLAPSTWWAHVVWLRREPRRYVGVVRDLVRDLGHGARTAPAREYAKTVIAFHQAVRLAVLVHDRHIDHVHAHFANHPATVAWVVHRLTGRPFSFTAHANDLFRTPPLLSRKAHDAAFVVAISEFNRRLLAHQCPDARVHVVHCGVDTVRFAVAPATGNGRRQVVCVAGFEPKKGHRDLVAAFADVVRRHDDVDLVLVGDGPERERVAADVRARGLDDRTRFLGARSSDDVRDLLHDATVFALPAKRDPTGRMDGIPVALMEAMASGVPVVTTAVSGIPELVADDSGIVVAPGDRAAIASAIEVLLDDGARAGALARQARARVERDFDLAREAARLGDLFAAAINASSEPLTPRGSR
jgi:colanic acid/amylovoran biosynthesis glycosyltransferase